METSLHRELKSVFAAKPDAVEVPIDGYRIDAVDDNGWLIEIQHASLSALRHKVSQLLTLGHQIRIIKPILTQKWIETLESRQGPVLRRRKSPKSARERDVFRELIHFTQVFPHPKLQLELLEVHVLEQRLDRTKKRWAKKSFDILDVRLLSLGATRCLVRSQDLWAILGNPTLPTDFDTETLSSALNEPRWFAQQIAYTLHKCGATTLCGKRGNARVYRKTRSRKAC